MIFASRRRVFLLDHAALFDAGFLACELAEVVEFCTTHLTMLVDGNGVDEGRLNGEDTFNTDVVAHLAYCETLFVAFAGDADNHTAVLLDTFFVAFLDTVSDCDGVAGEEFIETLACRECFFYNFD